jgi:hypothetical protein
LVVLVEIVVARLNRVDDNRRAHKKARLLRLIRRRRV